MSHPFGSQLDEPVNLAPVERGFTAQLGVLLQGLGAGWTARALKRRFQRYASFAELFRDPEFADPRSRGILGLLDVELAVLWNHCPLRRLDHRRPAELHQELHGRRSGPLTHERDPGQTCYVDPRDAPRLRQEALAQPPLPDGGRPRRARPAVARRPAAGGGPCS